MCCRRSGRHDRPDREIGMAGKDVDCGVREQEVELGARDRTAGIEVVDRSRRPDRSVLAGVGRCRLQEIVVRVGVDRSGEARVRNPAVIALEEVLDAYLPVGGEVGGVAGVKTDRRNQWIRGLLERRGWNRTAVAVANKNARIVWALLHQGGVYQEPVSATCG